MSARPSRHRSRGAHLAGALSVACAAIAWSCGPGLEARTSAAGPATPPVTAPVAPASDGGADDGEPRTSAALEAPVERAAAVPPTRPQAVAALADALHDRIAREAAGVPGGSALVFALVADDAAPLVVARGHADVEARIPATADTAFRVASVTKTFTAAAVLALRDSGALRLDEPLGRVLPELASVTAPHKDAPPLTLRHLLVHGAGLPRSGPWVAREPDYRSTEDEVLEAARRLALDPGTRHAYSNLGYAVLGLAVARAAKVPYRTFVERRLLAPLGMRATTFDETTLPAPRLARGYVERAGGGVVRAAPIANGAAEGAGGLWSTASDLARWVRFQLQAWPPRDDADRGPLRRASLREGHVAAMDIGLVTEASTEGDAGTTLAVRSIGMGLGWKIERSCAFEHVVEHGGDLGGYRTRLVLLPQRGVGFVLLANAATTPIDAIARRVLATLQAARGIAPRDGALPPPTPFRCVP